MEKITYKFLDEYLGDEVYSTKLLVKDSKYDTYRLCSKKNNTLILFFKVHRKEGSIIIFRGQRLTDLVSSFFSMEEKDSTTIIKDWFGNKHNVNKVGDLMKFVN